MDILLKKCDLDIVLELLKSKRLTLYFTEIHPGIQNTIVGNRKIFDLVSVALVDYKIEEDLFRHIYLSTDRRGYSKRATQKLLPFIKLAPNDEHIIKTVKDDVLDDRFIQSTSEEIIKFHMPEVDLSAAHFHFRTHSSGKGIEFISNFDLSTVKNGIDNSGITPEGILLHVIQARMELNFAENINSEISAIPISTSIIKTKFDLAYSKVTKSSTGISLFHDHILSDTNSLREVINSGERSFKELIELLDKADKFKAWLDNVKEDSSIIKQYYDEVTKGTWIDRLPIKIARWSIFSGIGIGIDVIATGGVSFLIAQGVSVADALLLDKALKGWNPSMFVQGNLEKFNKTTR